MNRLCRIVAVLFVAGIGSALAEESPKFSAVRRADEARIAATIAGDADKLSALLSEQLRYAYADGRVQNKVQFVAAAKGNTAKYLSVDPRDVELQSIADGAVAMDGRTHVVVEIAGSRVAYELRFLAIWREEAGAWRLLAYQSARLDLTEPGHSR